MTGFLRTLHLTHFVPILGAVPSAALHDIMPSGCHRRLHLVEEMCFFKVPGVKGLKSRARTRAMASREIAVRSNRVISVLQSMWSGTLGEEVYVTPDDGQKLIMDNIK